MQEEYIRDKYNQTHKLQATTLQNLLHNSFFISACYTTPYYVV